MGISVFGAYNGFENYQKKKKNHTMRYWGNIIYYIVCMFILTFNIFFLSLFLTCPIVLFIIFRHCTMFHIRYDNIRTEPDRVCHIIVKQYCNVHDIAMV